MKRKLIIFLIIILLIIAIVVGLWLRAQNTAEKNGTLAPTFREFIGLGVKNPSDPNSPTDTNSSDFTTDQTTGEPSTSLPPIPASTMPTNTSIFTNDTTSPTGAVPSDPTIQGTNGTTSGQGGINSGGGTTGTTGTPITPPTGTTVATAPQCSDEDMNITFTPEEINRLNVLKNRFLAIAETLYTDSDVATELANYDAFKAKSTKINELYQFCAQSPVFTTAQPTPVPPTPPPTAGIFGSLGIPPQPYGSVWPGNNGPINYRVPTPFWHDTTKDNQAFVHQGSNFRGIFNDQDLIFLERSIEHGLRLNLW